MRLLATAAVITLSSIAVAPALAQTMPVAPAMIPDGTLLDVTATGKTTRVPDLATIRAGVVTQAATAAAALSDNANRMSAVLSALKRAGIQPRDIATANVSLQPQYRYEDNKPPVITGYQATNTVSIRFRDIAKSGQILDALWRKAPIRSTGPISRSTSPMRRSTKRESTRSSVPRRARSFMPKRRACRYRAS